MKKNILIIIVLCVGGLYAQEHWGLRETDGSIHPLHTPNEATADTFNILNYGADPLDNDHDDQGALDQCYARAGNNDVIYFPAGYYNFKSGSIYKNTAHLKLKNGMNIIGAGKDSVFFISDFPLSTNEDNSTMMFYGKGVNNILIEGISFTSTYSGAMPTSVSTNNTDLSAPKYGIYLQGDGVWTPTYNITIRHCNFELIRSQMIRVAMCHDVVVKHCHFSNATDIGGGGAGYGVSIQGEGHDINRIDYPADCKHNLVDSCQFIGPYVRHGALIQYYAHNNVISNSYFTQTGYDAIDLHGEDEYLNEIVGNTVENVPNGAGVGVGNTGADHDASGYQNHIHHNTFINCREGVKVYLESPETQIYSNVANSCTRGVYIKNGPRTNIIANELKNCAYGILLEYDSGTLGAYDGNPDSVAIAENNIHNNTYGIKISAGTNIMMGENTFDTNTFDTDYASGVTFQSYTSTADDNIPEDYIIGKAYPNPFNPRVALSLEYGVGRHTVVNIYNTQGKLVDQLQNGYMQAGINELSWDAGNMPSGVYLLQVTAGEMMDIQKITLLK